MSAAPDIRRRGPYHHTYFPVAYSLVREKDDFWKTVNSYGIDGSICVLESLARLLKCAQVDHPSFSLTTSLMIEDS